MAKWLFVMQLECDAENRDEAGRKIHGLFDNIANELVGTDSEEWLEDGETHRTITGGQISLMDKDSAVRAGLRGAKKASETVVDPKTATTEVATATTTAEAGKTEEPKAEMKGKGRGKSDGAKVADDKSADGAGTSEKIPTDPLDAVKQGVETVKGDIEKLETHLEAATEDAKIG